MEVKAALEKLYARRRFGIRMGLEVERELLRQLGDPQNCCPAIHVAGTNGKGSVCAILDSVLRAGGQRRVGLYTSPHLVRFNERIRVNGRQIEDGEVAELIVRVEEAGQCAEDRAGETPTFFESTTAMAFEHFRGQGIDIGVIETGMGGRLDATNLIDPLVSVITPIGMEHSAYLGSDVESIAGEKAGIIKQGRPVVMGSDMPGPAADVIRLACRERRSALVEVGDRVSIRVLSAGLRGRKLSVETPETVYGTVFFPLAGRHQLGNLATALTVLEAVRAAGMSLTDEQIKAGIGDVSWPGRFQVLSEDPPVVLDGAHNPTASAALAATLRELLGKRRVELVVGMCADKDVGGFLAPLSRLGERAWVVPVGNERSVPPEDMVSAGRRHGLECRQAEVAEAVQEATEAARSGGGAVCITGSLFLVGEVLRQRET
ncbi:bifunctional folylpolyglutamate synthase/dihydrofolate synthase [Verrucomicrobiota bacterium]